MHPTIGVAFSVQANDCCAWGRVLEGVGSLPEEEGLEALGEEDGGEEDRGPATMAAGWAMGSATAPSPPSS